MDQASILHYDLIVAGGGMAGVGAAVAGAREGLRVLLIEKNGCLGGAMSTALVFPFMKYWTPVDGEEKLLSAGLFGEMRARERAYGFERGRVKFHPDYFKLILDDMVSEAGVDVLFQTQIFEVLHEGRALNGVRTTSVAGVQTFTADFFVDATGDGNLFALAGCAHRVGRPEDGLCQPMTTCFRLCGVDLEQFYADKPRLQEEYRAARERGEIKNPRENLLTFRGIGEGVLHFNTTRVVKEDPTDPFAVSRAAIESRRQIHEVITFLKKHTSALDHATLVSIAPEIGVRESRMLDGEYVLTAEDLLALTMFEDRIALANYDIDIHNPAGTGTDIHYFKEGEYYSIPYRSLLPREYDNLLVAGRCLSATHEAQAAVRVMPICACMGEAAGTAIALAAASGKSVRAVDVAALQQRLLQKGAAL